jgi:hypothetical protein
MSDITKINFSKDVFQRPDTSAILNGSVYIDQNFYIKNIEIDTSGATTNNTLVFDGIKFLPTNNSINLNLYGVELSNVSFCDAINGNDLTGSIGNLNKTFKTINEAKNSLSTKINDDEDCLVYIFPGVYEENNVLAVDGKIIKYYGSADAKISLYEGFRVAYPSSSSGFNDAKIYFYGDADIILPYGSFYYDGGNSGNNNYIYCQCNSIEQKIIGNSYSFFNPQSVNTKIEIFSKNLIIETRFISSVDSNNKHILNVDNISFRYNSTATTKPVFIGNDYSVSNINSTKTLFNNTTIDFRNIESTAITKTIIPNNNIYFNNCLILEKDRNLFLSGNTTSTTIFENSKILFDSPTGGTFNILSFSGTQDITLIGNNFTNGQLSDNITPVITLSGNGLVLTSTTFNKIIDFY